MTHERVLIIGAGQAGSQTATSLRQAGFEGQVTLLGEEPALPYQRPPLSKAYLKGQLDRDRLYLKPGDWYVNKNIEVITDARISRVDIEQKVAETDGGHSYRFDHLVFATGSRNRDIAIPGTNLNNVFGLRTLDDVDQLRPQVEEGRHLVIIGAGYIGLETAAAARSLGMTVTVLELGERVLARVTSPTISDFFEALHRENGVEIRTSVSVSEIADTDGQVSGVILSSGESLPCDAVLIGVGIVPNIELADAAGIRCEDGIVVDAEARTNIGHVFAAGDCTNRTIAPYQRAGRLESVHNAIEQGKQAAASIAGTPPPKIDCPWFWSDQYDVKLQIAGLSADFDSSVLRGSVADKKFAVFYFKQGTLIAVDAVNSPPEYLAARSLILNKDQVDPTILKDESYSMKDIAARYKT